MTAVSSACMLFASLVCVLLSGFAQAGSSMLSYASPESQGVSSRAVLFGLSILAVYVVMMVLFGSGFIPLTRMLPSTLAILGAVLLHAVTGVPMSFYSQFAILLLSVICTAVSLLATDRDGFLGGAFPALVLAVLVVPLVFAFGAGSAGSRSLGVALLGGFALYSQTQGIRCQNGSTCCNVRMRKNLLVLLPLICAAILFGGCACSGREPVSARYKTPGVIGGMGPSATCDLMQKIIDNTDAADDQHNIHLLVDQNTDVPDRTAAILRGGADPMPELIRSARRLENAGADFLCMSCNTAHYFHERLSREVSIPILNMPAESAKELKRRGVRKVGLLATDGTIRTGVYHRFLKAEGIEVVVPDDENQATVMALIYDCVKKNVPAKDYPAEAVARTIADLKSKGAEAYLLACTELPIAFERLGYKEGFLDPTLVLARAVVREAGAPLRGLAVVANASVVSPESQGVSSRAIQDWIEACETTSATNGFKGGYLHGFVIMRHGRTIAEGTWAPQDTLNEPHMLYSHSKSFTVTAIGFLVDDGKLDIDERIVDLFPDKMPVQASDNLRQLRVRDLLTMNTGAEKTDAERDDIRGDWIRAILANEFQHAPGTVFRYDSAATHLLAAIVERKSGRKLMEFLGERLFRPLGMTSPWSTTSPEGVACGGWGMNMTTRDMAKFGQFLLQKGVWEDRRLMSSEWIDLATARQTWSSKIVVASQTIGSGSDWAQGYGFQFWRCRHGAFRADGASGQLTVVFPKEDAVVSVNAGLGDMQRELDLIWQYLLPAFGGAVLPEDQTASSALAAKCATLALPLDDPSSKPFLDMDKAVVERTTDGWVLVKDGRRLAVGDGKWATTEWHFSDDLVEPLFEWCGTRKIAANGRLDEEGALLVSWQFLGGVAHGCFKVTSSKLKE